MLEAAAGQGPALGAHPPLADASVGGDVQAEAAAGDLHAHEQFVGQRSAANVMLTLRFAIASNKKVAVLKDCYVAAEVVSYVHPGTVFSVGGAKIDVSDGRSCLGLTDGRHWLGTHAFGEGPVQAGGDGG
ncbi:unnamed protein product [Prorocentrum cordatum]|uniref:Altered inheritance of mitochondria protein 24, mitochondrial n=1 Tax=Prorocentrum cordatum TaxID=2364126 RepID=A0ABN9YJX5_9DINO|nr:unnamed protein product [Polarella glacialis]